MRIKSKSKRHEPCDACSQCHYLVLCRGRPYRNSEGFGHKACRIDALARIVPAALMHGRTLHLIFEDCTILSLTPPFLSDWQPWSRSGSYATENRLQKILDGVVWTGQSMPGVQLRWGERMQQCIEKVMTDGAPFHAVITLSEVGCPLIFSVDSEGSHASNGHSTAEPLPRTLVVLGGVRDMSEEEDECICHVCTALQIPRYLVSLGPVS